MDKFPTTKSLQDSLLATYIDYFTPDSVHHTKSTNMTNMKLIILFPIKQRLFKLLTPDFVRRSKKRRDYGEEMP